MRRLLGVVGLALVCLAGCAPFTRQDAKSALDAADVVCILAQPMTHPDSEIAAMCSIADALIPALRKLLAARRASYRTCLDGPH